MLTEAWASESDALLFADHEPIGPRLATHRRNQPPVEPILAAGIFEESVGLPARDDLVGSSSSGASAIPSVAVSLVRHYPVVAPRRSEPAPVPAPPGTLVGRDAETAAILALLHDRSVRLLTLTGPGGVGKTRLAIEVGQRLAREVDRTVRFVSLATVREPAGVLPTIAQALGIAGDGVGSPVAPLRDALGDQRSVLILDNLEQVVDSGSELAALLIAAPELTILATSRAPLRVRAEREFPVPPLSLPGRGSSDDGLSTRHSALGTHRFLVSRLSSLDSDAVRLFVERARAVNPSFTLTDANAADVAAICARLDGLPLAIELAAARTAVLSPKTLLARLHRRLTDLTGGPGDLPARQRTLGRTIAWSHDLLTPAEQTIFRRLAVFSGGFTIEGVEGVIGGVVSVLDGLERLVAQSLVMRVQAEGEPRFRLLESVREFAMERLSEAGEVEMVADGHLRWFADLAEQAESGLVGPAQRTWLDRLDVERDNIRSALSWALGHASARSETADYDRPEWRAELGLRLAAGLWRFWSARGCMREGQEWLGRAVAAPPDAAPNLRAKATNNLGNLANDLGDFPGARGWYETALSLRQEGGDQRGYATTASNLGLLAIHQGDYPRAIALLEESLRVRRELADRPGLALSLGNLGDAAIAAGDLVRAADLHSEALVLQQALGDEGGIAYALHNLADVARHRGDHGQARGLYLRSIDQFRAVGDRLGLGFPLVGLSRLAAFDGELVAAARLLGEALELRRQLGDRRGVVECLERVAALAVPFGLAEDGVGLLGAASAMRDALGAPLPHAERAEHERLVESLRRLLPGDRFAAAWATGRDRTLEAAIAAAAQITAYRPAESDLIPVTAGDGAGRPVLSVRELDVLRLVADGMTNTEVAERLYLSPRTVHAHLYRIYNKLGVSTRAAATRRALEQGLV